MFTDEAIEQMVLDAFDELCSDQGIEGAWAEEGPLGLALIPDPMRLGAAVDLWMRVENREETARQHIVERTTIFGSRQMEVSGDDDDAVEEIEDEGEVEAGAVSDEPLLDEIELRGRLLGDVVNTVSRQLSDRRGAQELGEDLPTLESVHQELLEAINISFSDRRLHRLWNSNTYIAEAAE